MAVTVCRTDPGARSDARRVGTPACASQFANGVVGILASAGAALSPPRWTFAPQPLALHEKALDQQRTQPVLTALALESPTAG